MIIDLTHEICDNLAVFPGDDKTELIQSRVIQKDYYNNHYLKINMHAGTHIDGPMHLLDTNTYINEFPIDRFFGQGCLIDVSGETVVEYKKDYETLIEQDQIVILYTGHSKYFGQPNYFTDYPVLSDEMAALFIRKKVKMIGLDTPSPDKYPFNVHKILFKNNILIAENLTNVEQLLNVNSFEIIALPLRVNADSSIARIVARVET